MVKRYKKKNMGSVSHGTMRAEDLIPTFLDELKSQTPVKREHIKLAREIQARLDQDSEENPYFEDGDSDSDLDELFTALDSYCLPYFYFGAHCGDGADYGYWLSESFTEDFDGIKVSSNGFKDTITQGRETLDRIPKGFTGEVLQVNDHGNCTLLNYTRGRARMVWSVV